MFATVPAWGSALDQRLLGDGSVWLSSAQPHWMAVAPGGRLRVPGGGGSRGGLTTVVVNSKGCPWVQGEVQGPKGLRALDPVVSIQRGPCCSLELASTWSGAVAPSVWRELWRMLEASGAPSLRDPTPVCWFPDAREGGPWGPGGLGHGKQLCPPPPVSFPTLGSLPCRTSITQDGLAEPNHSSLGMWAGPPLRLMWGSGCHLGASVLLSSLAVP